MIKKIMAAKNDHVEFTEAGVVVNGKLLLNSKPMDRDAEGRTLSPIKSGIIVLDARSVLLMSDYNPKSFDARYFGALDKVQVISVIQLILTW